MAKRSVLDILKRIGLSFRRNWGLKLVSLGFAVILWNYVIVEINPIRTIPFNGIKVTFDDNSIIRLKNSGFTVSGALPDKKVNVSVNLPRNETLGHDDVKAVVDLSGITSEGLVEVKVSGRSARGTVVSTSPDTITVKIDKLAKRSVPVECVYEGTLPGGYWRGEPKINPSVLQIAGASTLVSHVERARIIVSLTDLKQKLSASTNFILLDSQGNELDQGGITLEPSNCIVDLEVFPTKTVKVDVSKSINGSVAKGYEIVGEPEVSLKEIVIAGPQEILDTITSVSPVEPINISGRKEPKSDSKLMLKLPPGTRAVGENSITVFINVALKMTTVTLSDIRITIDLVPGLKVKQTFTANVTISCPELYATRIKRSQVHLSADATELGAGTHTLTVTGTYGDPEAQAEIIDISPKEIPVKIETTATP